MEPYPINSPKWNGGDYEVGLADFRIPKFGKARIEIKYTRKTDGQPLRPGIYEMESRKLKTYPTQVVGANKNVKLYVSPLSDWERVA